MKKTMKTIVISGFLLMSFTFFDEIVPAFNLRGEIEPKAKIAYLHQLIDGRVVKSDSVEIVNGVFDFKEQTLSPQMMYLSFDNSKKIPIFVENSNILIDVKGLSTDSVFISGSLMNEEWKLLSDELNIFDEKTDSLYHVYLNNRKSGNQELLDQIDAEYEMVEDEKKDFLKTYIQKNPNSFISPYIIARFMMNTPSAKELKSSINLLGNEVGTSVYMTGLNTRVTTLEKTEIGNVIPNFSLPNTVGDTISIESFRGEYVLIDFWASWCGPCRKENPNVVIAFEKYKDRGFTVFGVSLDTEKNKWEKAIKKDKLKWAHVSDLKGWENSVAVDFGVRSIPFSILIDPEGKVLAKNLKGEELQAFLAQIFNK